MDLSLSHENLWILTVVLALVLAQAIAASGLSGRLRRRRLR
jgi:hypothetical protein